MVFYVVVLGAGLDLDTLRRDGWLFEVARSEKWYRYYTYFGAFHLRPRIPFTSLTVPRFYEGQMGPILGNATHAICAVVLQCLASSSQCPCSRYVPYGHPVRVNGMLMVNGI